MPKSRAFPSNLGCTVNSRHLVRYSDIYARSFMTAFDQFYGRVRDYVILGLLPSYLERQHSSLVRMVQEMTIRSRHRESGFYLYEHDKLYQQLQELERTQNNIVSQIEMVLKVVK